MILKDRFYGDFELEQVLVELINSVPVQRLKHIHQGGAIFLVSPVLNHSRFEHSIGVMLLVRGLGAGLEEQIAALLHDVSHTAFSHISDYVFGFEDEDFHEQIFKNIVLSSDIPSILLANGFNPELVFDEDYTLLEMPLPDLCADRLDYTLRDLFHFGLITLAEVQAFLNKLTVFKGRIAVKNPNAAVWITEKYSQLNLEYFRKPEHIFANLKFAELINKALSKGVLIPEDLHSDDDTVLSKIESDQDLTLDLQKIKKLDGFVSFSESKNRKTFKERILKPLVVE